MKNNLLETVARVYGGTILHELMPPGNYETPTNIKTTKCSKKPSENDLIRWTWKCGK